MTKKEYCNWIESEFAKLEQILFDKKIKNKKTCKSSR